MKYVLLICDDESISPSQEELAADPVMQAWDADLEGRGAEQFGARLRPSVHATTVRVRQGETLVSDGPFAETKDLVGGVVAIGWSLIATATASVTRRRTAHPSAIWRSVVTPSVPMFAGG